MTINVILLAYLYNAASKTDYAYFQRGIQKDSPSPKRFVLGYLISRLEWVVAMQNKVLLEC